MKNFSIDRLAKIFLYLFVFFVPFQVKTLVFSSDVFSSGFMNPYLSHFIYISDIFLFLALFFLLLSLFFKKLKWSFKLVDQWFLVLLLLFLGAYVFSLLSSVEVANSWLYFLRAFEFFVFYLMFSQGFLKLRTFMLVFLSAVSVTAFIGIFQYVFQSSIGLHFLGEPHISADALDVARYSFSSEVVMRAYGTFAHPNVFAGFLLFAIFFASYLWKEAKGEYRVVLALLTLVLLLALVLTFSRSGWLALFAAGMLYYAVSNVKLSVKYVSLAASLALLFVIVFDLSDVIFSRIFVGDSNSVFERSLYFKASWNMFLAHPFGVGAGNFTDVMQGFLDLKLEPWRFQPVHNIYLLVLNELGVIAFTVFLGIFTYTFSMMLKGLKKLKDLEMNYMLLALWLGIFVIGLFDHYFISLYQGQFLFWSFLGLYRLSYK